MYTIEERSYGLKITFDEMPSSEDLSTLSDVMKTQLREKIRKNNQKIVSLILTKNKDQQHISPMIYVFDS